VLKNSITILLTLNNVESFIYCSPEFKKKNSVDILKQLNGEQYLNIFLTAKYVEFRKSLELYEREIENPLLFPHKYMYMRATSGYVTNPC